MSATWQEPVIDIVQVTGAITTIDLKGDFDTANAPEVIEHAQRVLASGRHVIVNLSEATFIDSAIVHALFTVNETAVRQGRRFVLQLGSHPGVERVLSMTGTDKSLVSAFSLTEAIDSIQSPVR
jgi:anti-sigma B factor antagonist